MTARRNDIKPAGRQDGARLSVALTSFFFLMSIATGRAAPRPGRMESALACLLSQPTAQDVLRNLGLRLGETAALRYFIGSIPGMEPSPGEYTLMIDSPDHSRAWLLAAEPAPDGRFVPIDEAFQLRRTGARWMVEEGFGGLATYQAMGQFATWLSRHSPEYHVILRAHPDRCAPHDASRSSAVRSTPPPPVRLQKALGCLLGQRNNVELVAELGLKPGDTAWIRYYVGTIPGSEPTPGEYYIAVYASNQNSAWLLIADPANNGLFQPIANAYRFQKLRHGWQADEGNGGLGTYRTMSHFAAWLVQHRRSYRVVLKAHPEFCSGPAE